ncbi:MAG TPA: DUF6064 family protein [Gemmatimonadales bacterium]|jgi:hypothetical protein
MRLPFDATQFFAVFARYNAAVWPAPIVLAALAFGAALLAARGRDRSSRAASGILALLWIWMGAVYHLGFFRSINPAATVFGAMFLIQGIAFATVGTLRGSFGFHFRADGAGWTGTALMAFALAGYPLLADALGHRYPMTPTFGLPCPTTIFTLGLLLWARPAPPTWILVVPLAWSVLGVSAALQLGVYEDLSLLAAGVVSAAVMLGRSRTASVHPGQLTAPG